MAMSLAVPPLPPVAAQWVERLGGPRRVGILGVGLLSVLLILGVARWAAAPEWIPVMRDVSLESAGEITDRLGEAGIEYRLADGGARLLVPAADLARARVMLARDGGLTLSGRPGMELFDQPSWGMTDFTQRINYRRALEGELERTIGEMRTVEAAKVHLAMAESPGFRQPDRPAEASVVLKLRGGQRPDEEVVRGIAHLVSSSVDGIDAERVSVLDDTGRLLSSPYESGSVAAAATRNLETRRAVEQYLETKAEDLVSRMVGPDNIRVQVSADLNYNQIQRTTESVDPDGQVIASEQRAEIIPGAEGGAGSTNLSANYLNSRTVESFSSAVGAIRQLTVAVMLNEGAAGEGEVWTEERLAKVQGLVRNAVGINDTRGDRISVVSVPFRADPFEEVPSPGWTAVLLPLLKPGIAVLALLLAAAVAFLVVRAFRVPNPAVPPAADGVPLLDRVAGAAEEVRAVEGLEPVLALPSPHEIMRDDVAAGIRADPDVSVRVVRTWLKEE